MKITAEQRANILSKGVHLFGDSSRIKIGFSRDGSISVEPPAQLREGTYDVNHLGAFSYLGGGNSSLRHIESIGRFCAIAGNVVIGQVEHPTNWLSPHPFFVGHWGNEIEMLNKWYQGNKRIKSQEHAYNAMQRSDFPRVKIGNDCWIGEGVFIRRGVNIGDGVIVASRSVVTSDIPAYSIVAGIPARIIRRRFSEEIIEKLLEIQWWKYGVSILQDVDATDIEKAVDKMIENIALGVAQPYSPNSIQISNVGLENYDAI